MKKCSNGIVVLVFGILFWNGCTKDPSLGNENYITEKRTSLFQDTSYVEFHHIINILSEQSDSMITFQTRYGYPSVYGTFKKKNETIKITTIPLVKYNKITGIFRIYITHEDSIRIHFYSKENIDSAMNTSLNSKNFHLYNGAIQGYVFSAAKRGEIIDNKYIQWLEVNQNRLEERVGFYCIEDWDCIEAYRSPTSGIIYSDPGHTNQIGWSLNASGNGLNGFYHCFLISYECYYDWSQHGFIFSSGNGWNHYPWITNSSSGGTGNGNNNPKIKRWEEQVLIDAKDCLQQAGINGARAMKALQDATKNSCGESYNDLLARTYQNLLDQGKSCTDSAALAEEVKNTVDKTETVFFDDEVMEFFEENELIDPCSGEKISDMLKNEACANQKTLDMEALEEKLDGFDYIINNISNPRINCLWKKLMNSNNNVICEQISYYEGKTELNLKIFSQDLNGQNAITWFDDRDGQPYISFDEGISTKCDIEIIKTMIHESVHAGILNIVKGTHAAGWGINDVPELKNYYDNYSLWHHEYMAGAYFEELVSALKQYFGNEYTDLVYEAIMWKGLHNTTAYRALPQSKRNQIENIWDQFNNSTTCKKSCL
ncbi:MAG: hypothetical protein IPN10_14380 [Saprospiraceae bacterium]|nr:hypothetical protein [Saprospiraceae bacterium]